MEIQNIHVNQITYGKRMRPLKPEAVRDLAESIEQIGLLTPIAVSQDMKLIAGHHRLEAVKRLGWQVIPANVCSIDELHARLAEIDENLVRNDLTALEHGEHLAERKAIYEALHPETKRGTAGVNASNKAQGKGHATAESAVASFVADTSAKTGASERTVRTDVQIGTAIAKPVRDLIRETELADKKTELLKLAQMPEEQQQAVAEKIVGGEARTVTEAARQVKAADVLDRHIEQPTGKYRVIYADPPWSYGNTQPDYHSEQRDHYPVMSLAEICALPVKDMAEDDAVLFLWVTSPILEDSFKVVKAWGFQYKTTFVWDKVKHNMGHYNSVRHEFVLVCTRGSCQPDVRKLYDSVITEERTAHSVKPALMAEIIDTIYPKGRRVELFARASRQGWDQWGAEAQQHA